MADSITTRVSRGISGEEGIEALEQEAFIDGSSEFHPNFAAAGLESTLNNLVGISFFPYYRICLCFYGTILWPD